MEYAGTDLCCRFGWWAEGVWVRGGLTGQCPRARDSGGTRWELQSVGLGEGLRDQVQAQLFGQESRQEPTILGVGMKPGRGRHGDLHEDAVCAQDFSLAAQDLRPLPVPGGEHGGAG